MKVGLQGSASDAGFYLGVELGYFRELGLAVELVPFDSGARMVAPLGAGQLQVGGGSHSAGLLNAVARGIEIKLVADKGSAPPGHGFFALLLRRELVDGGQVRAPGDLRGRKVAIPANGTTADPTLARWLRTGGLGLDDVELVELPFVEHPAAFAGGAVDASVTLEPFVTRIAEQGSGVVYQRTDELYPGQQIGEVLYGGEFARAQPDAARRFMVGYLRAARFYHDAMQRGDAAKRQQVVQVLAAHTSVKDPALYDKMAMPGLDPDGRMNLQSLADDQDFWLAAGLQQARVNLDEVVDYRFVEAALAALGPHR